MIFKDGEKTLKLQVLGYEFPELNGKGAEYSFEANWLVLRGTYTNEDGETAIFTKGCVLTYELTALAAELKVLAAGLKNGFISDFEEPVLFMEVDAVEEGNFRVKVSFVMDMDDADLEPESIEMTMTAEEVKALAAEVQELADHYPEKKND